MAFNIKKELKSLLRMTTKQLREKYLEVFSEQTRAGNKEFLVKRIVWRLQANHEGGLSERALRRAAELANDSDLRIRMPKDFDLNAMSAPERTTMRDFPTERDPRIPQPNTVLIRKYKGQDIEVTVLENGFDYKGATFKTLSAVAKEVTGSHWNGFAFFKI